MTTAISECEYGHWPSPLSPERVFAASETMTYVRPTRLGVFFLLSMPEEGNASALMFLSFAAGVVRVTPEGVNVRSRLQEYGGLPYAFTDEAVFYVNYRDQQVIRQPFDQSSLQGEEGTPLTPPSECQLRYADFLMDAARSRLLCVREDHRLAGEPQTTLVAIDILKGGEGEILFSDSDFVAAPALSPTGDSIAFQTWSHPNMPWDCTEIRIADIDGRGNLRNERQIVQPVPGAAVQPLFHPSGDLYFLADWTDWWNLYRVPANVLSRPDPDAQVVVQMEAEMCAPLWQLGQRHFAFLDDATVVFSYIRDCFWTLAALDLPTAKMTTLRSGLGSLDHVSCAAGRVIYFAAGPDSGAAIECIAAQSGALVAEGYVTLFACERSDGLEEAVAAPEHLTLQGEAGTTFGVFYAPCNPCCAAPEGTLPPLLVLVHGGPTGTARTGFNPAIQFWTSRGFAVLDVNHRGSSGYGRRFRQSLYGEWGVADVADVDAAVRGLIEQARVNPSRIAIRGGSAGGYVVLAALVHSDLFRAGACYYGISDLEMLAKDTHKFESRYLDQLIGPYPEAQALYRARSPLYHLDSIHAAVLLLQGMEDKVVPPNQTQTIESRLRLLNPATRCIYFPDEGHGFRKPVNQIAALEAELKFYQDNLLVE